MAKSIDVSDLDIYYGDFLAVEGVTMTIKARSVTAFIGPSGCGKSTFLRSLNRMHEVIPGARVEGKVVVDGQDLYGPERRPGRRTPPDRHGLPAAEPVPDDVDLRQRPRGQQAERQADEEVRGRRRSSSSRCAAPTSGTRSRTGSTSPAWASPAASSSGSASPARSPSSPQVLLMDEPCSALDPISTSAIEDLIHELKSEYTIVIVTHNMQQAARVSDETGVLQPQGRRQARPPDRVQPDQEDLHQPRRRVDRGLHLRPLRLSSG